MQSIGVQKKFLELGIDRNFKATNLCFINSSTIPEEVTKRKDEICFINLLCLGWNDEDLEKSIGFINILPNLKHFCTDLTTKKLEKFGFTKDIYETHKFTNNKLQGNTNSLQVYIYSFDAAALTKPVENFPVPDTTNIDQELITKLPRVKCPVLKYIPENLSIKKKTIKSNVSTKSI